MIIDMAKLIQAIEEDFEKRGDAIEKNTKSDRQAIRMFSRLEIQEMKIKEKIADIIKIYSLLVLKSETNNTRKKNIDEK